MRTSLVTLFALTLLAPLSGGATDVIHLSVDEFSPSIGTCQLKQLGFMTDSNAAIFGGVVQKEQGGHLCTISIPRKTFDSLYQYCAIAAVEILPTADYFCGVTHFKQSVEFSYRYKYGDGAAPLCSFVCPLK